MGMGYLLVLKALVRDDILLALGGIEVNRKFNSLRLIDSEG